jgi:hypothetical protein
MTWQVDGDGQISMAEFAKLESGDGDPSLDDLLMPYSAPDAVFEDARPHGSHTGHALPRHGVPSSH